MLWRVGHNFRVQIVLIGVWVVVVGTLRVRTKVSWFIHVICMTFILFIFQSMHVQGQHPRARVMKFITKDEDGTPFRIGFAIAGC